MRIKMIKAFGIMIGLVFLGAHIFLNYNLQITFLEDDIYNERIIDTLITNGKLQLSNELNANLSIFENDILVIPSQDNINTIQYKTNNFITTKEGFPKLDIFIIGSLNLINNDYNYVFLMFGIIISIIIIYRLLCEALLIDKIYGILVFLSGSSIILFWTLFNFGNIYGLLFALISILFYIRYINGNEPINKNIILSIFFLMPTVFIRFEYLLFIGLFYILIFFQRKSYRNTIFIFLIIFIIVSILTNNIQLSDLINSYYKYNFSARVIENIIYTFSFRGFEALRSNLKGYLFYNPVFTIGFIASIFLIFTIQKNHKKIQFNTKIIYILGIVNIFILYFFLKNGDYWGYNMGRVGSSYTRYILLSYILSLIIVSFQTKSLNIFSKFILISTGFILGYNTIYSKNFGINHIIQNYNTERISMKELSKKINEKNGILIDATNECYLSKWTVYTDVICIKNKNINIDLLIEKIQLQNREIYVINDLTRTRTDGSILNVRQGGINLITKIEELEKYKLEKYNFEGYVANDIPNIYQIKY